MLSRLLRLSSVNAGQAFRKGAALLVCLAVTALVASCASSPLLVASPAGLDWQWCNPLPGNSDLHAVVFAQERFIAVGDSGTILVSREGDTWERSAAPATVPLNGIAYRYGRFVAVGGEWARGYSVSLVSTDGLHWKLSKVADGNQLSGVAYGNDLFVAVGNSWTGDLGVIFTSQDGVTWVMRKCGACYLRDIIFDGDRFIVTSEEGTFLCSANGVDWVQITSTAQVYSVARGAGTCVGVGGTTIEGPLAFKGSADLQAWTPSPLPGEAGCLIAVVYGGGQFVSVGCSGTVLTSADGLTWAQQPGGIESMLNDVAYGSGHFVAVGHEGAILSSSGPSETAGGSVWSPWTLRVAGTRLFLSGSVTGGAGGIRPPVGFPRSQPRCSHHICGNLVPHHPSVPMNDKGGSLLSAARTRPVCVSRCRGGAGEPSPRRSRAAYLFLAVVFLCSESLAVGGCGHGLPGKAGHQAKAEAFAGLLPKPELPELKVTCGERSAAGRRAAYAWALNGSVRQLDEVWAPPTPSDRLVVSPGEEVVFDVTLPAGSPKAAEDDENDASARIDVWNAFAVQDGHKMTALHSGDCQSKDRNGSIVRFSWRIPDALPGQQGDNAFVVRFTATWGVPADPGSGAGSGAPPGSTQGATSDGASSPWVSFYWNLVIAEKSAMDAVLSTVRRYFDATWAGDEETLAKVSPEWSMNEPAVAVGGISPLRAHLPGSRDPILWESPSQAFKLVSRPSLLVDSVHPTPSGPYAQCVVEYQVEVRDAESRKTERQMVREQVGLRAGDDASWTVSWASRSPVPDSSRPLPALTARTDEDIAIARIGPFQDVPSHLGQKWSDDGEWFAFVAGAADVNGMWAANRDGSKLLSLVGLKGTAVDLLGWVPGQHKVRFLAYGYHSSGPHADKSGYWVGEADLSSGEVRDIAFIRYPRVSFPKDVAMPEGCRYLVFRHTPDLWRVDMETGETVRVAGDVPSWDGLLRLRYSPSAWFAAYGEPLRSSRPGFNVYDLRAGEQRFVSLPGGSAGDLWAHFEGWTPKEELMVLLCPADEVNSGEDSSEPAGATALRLYSPRGALLGELLPPGDDADCRIGPVAWNEDGSALAVAIGRLSGSFHSLLGWRMLRYDARAIYVWTRSDGIMRKLADIAGQVQSLSWVEDGTVIEAWFRVLDDQNVQVQTGVRVHLDGAVAEVVRPLGYDIAEGDFLPGSLGDLIALERIGSAKGSTLIIRSGVGTSDGRETVVNDVGPLYLDQPVIAFGAFAVSGEVPDRHGLGDHWVYLVVPPT